MSKNFFFKAKFLFLHFFLCSIYAYTTPIPASDSFFLKGRIIGRSNGYIYLNYQSSFGVGVFDSAKIVNEEFLFKGKIGYPVLATLKGNRKTKYMNDPELVEFFISPGVMNLQVKEKEFKKFILKGSNAQAEKQDLEFQRKKIEDKRSIYSFKIEQLKDSISNSKDIELKNKLNRYLDSNILLYKSYDQELQIIDLNFVKHHPASFISPYIIEPYLYSLSADSLYNLFNNLKYFVRKSAKWEYIFSEIKKKRNSYPFAFAPLFSTNTYDGKKLNLESYRGKSFILLDFWASWCIPCRRSFPALKNLYKKYNEKGFEVIGISQDIDNDAWKKAIFSDSVFVWKHVLIAVDIRQTFSGKRNTNDIIEKYFINGIPVQILIDREGRIIKRWDGENPQNISELDSILNAKLIQ
ncbi:MAG: AhpC/TSA family protein [Hydrotalea flava]|nr:AhpC/TSA family protein [Hydrotalea flava]